MSGATDAVVVVAEGTRLAGEALYLAAGKVREYYAAALAEYRERTEQEHALRSQRKADAEAARQQAAALAVQLGERALEDPNAAFLLGGLNRLQQRLNQLPASAEAESQALLAKLQQLAQAIAGGSPGNQLESYDKLSREALELVARLAAGNGITGAAEGSLREIATREIGGFRDELDASVFRQARHRDAYVALIARLDQLQALADRHPASALQGLSLLQERYQGELRAARALSQQEEENAARVRELAGEISSQARAISMQEALPEARREAGEILSALSRLVTATPVSLPELETLLAKITALYDGSIKSMEEQAMTSYLDAQVSEVLGSLGYRVTRAGRDNSAGAMVAVLDSRLGVELRVDGQGQLSGEMVAFSSEAAVVDALAQERVCELMDAIFAGLRRKNLTVREKKRKHFRPGEHHLKVVSPAQQSAPAAPAVQAQPLRQSGGGL